MRVQTNQPQADCTRGKELLAKRIHGGLGYGRQIGREERAWVCLLNALPACEEVRRRSVPCCVDRRPHSKVGIEDEEGESRRLGGRMCWVARMMKMCSEWETRLTKGWQVEKTRGVWVRKSVSNDLT
jgi:hypothetical protein